MEKKIRRAKVLYLEDGVCDCCDKHKEIAILDLFVINFTWHICKDCLEEFKLSFYTEQEIRNMKLKKITTGGSSSISQV